MASASAVHHRLIIIGSGPAGFTAGIYAARANLAPVLIEGIPREYELPGGQLMITTDVENYPGFPKGIQGPELMQLFREQTERFGTQIISDYVSQIDFNQRPFTMRTEGGLAFTADAVIVATGAQAKWLGIPSETALRGFGVSACATCDGAFFKNQDVVVVGGGDTAMEEATFLTHHAKRVYVSYRRGASELRASKIMQERARKSPKIEFLFHTEVDEILGQTGHGGGVKGVRLKDPRSGETRTLDVQGLFVAIGHKPNTDFLRGQLALDENGYVLVQGTGTATSVRGVFAAGDVADHIYRQAVTAAGTGCMAAIDAERYLAHAS
jgi:thioredoxin reductase (NADPH)